MGRLDDAFDFIERGDRKFGRALDDALWRPIGHGLEDLFGLGGDRDEETQSSGITLRRRAPGDDIQLAFGLRRLQPLIARELVGRWYAPLETDENLVYGTIQSTSSASPKTTTPTWTSQPCGALAPWTEYSPSV